MDNVFDKAQKQGRLSLYMATVGEEVINIASAAALTTHDIVLPQVIVLSQTHNTNKMLC